MPHTTNVYGKHTMSVFGTMFQACCEQMSSLVSLGYLGNVSSIEAVCRTLTERAMFNHQATGVLDFEQIVSVDVAWWVYGLYYVIAMSLTAVLNMLSIHIFLDVSMRSPTTYLLAGITALDLLTCLSQAPVNIHAYLLERYKDLPTYTWCEIYNYVHNFLPSALHSAAFLLNMYLSVQRCVGIRDVRPLRVVGTYRASIIASVVCVVLSFTIHSMYPITISIEEVTAISKKVISVNGYDYTQSCRVVPRFPAKYNTLYSAYLWLRVCLLQVIPALVMTVCNIFLVHASYKTYAYRKRLVGALGVFVPSCPNSLGTDDTFLSSRESCSQASTAVVSTITTGGASNFQRLSEARLDIARYSLTCHPREGHLSNIPGNTCARQMRSDSAGICVKAAACSQRVNHRFSTGNISWCGRDGQVAPETFFHRIEEELKPDTDIHTDGRPQNRHFSFCTVPSAVGCAPSSLTKPLYFCCHETDVGRCKDSKCRALSLSANLYVVDDSDVHIQKERAHMYFENIPKTSKLLAPFKDVNNLEAMRTSLSQLRRESMRIDDISKLDRILQKQKSSDFNREYIGYAGCLASFIASNKQSTCDNRDASSSLSQPSSLPIKCNSPETHGVRHSYSNNRFRPHLSTQHSITSISAEIRSSIMLILVTSCTLLAEVFVVVLLILIFLNNFVWPDGQFLSDSDLSTAIMASNATVTLTFPLNFLFFCGLSQAFRSALTSRLSMFTGRCKRTS